MRQALGIPDKEREGKDNECEGKGLLRNSAVYLLSNVLNAAIPLLLLPILTRYLSPAAYGLVAMYQMILVFLAAFTGFSVHGAANRKFFDQDEGIDLPAYIGSCVQILLVSTFLVLLSVWLFRVHLVSLTGLTEYWILAAVIVSGASFLVQLLLGQWLVRSRSRQYGLFQVGQSLFNLALSLLLVVGLSWGWEGRLWGLSMAVVGAGLLALAFLFTSGQLRMSWRPDYIRSALAFGVALIPHVMGMAMFNVLDRAIIQQSQGLGQTGIYMVAVQLALGMVVVSDAINKAYVPWLYARLKANELEVKRRIVTGTYVYFAVALLIALVVALVAPWFVPWFAGPDYTEAGRILGWLALGQAFNGMYLMVTNYIFYSQRTGMLSLVTVSTGALHLCLVYLLVDTRGIEGAGIAFAISMSLRFVLTWYVAHLRHPMPWFSMPLLTNR